MSSELVNKLYEKIENRILNGEYIDNAIITEQGIAKEFEVSRTPVREVFQLLYANGYIAFENKNAHIKAFSQKDMLDIYDLRILMEGMSARLCTENISSENMNRLQEIILLQNMYLSQNNTKKLLELDDSFHEVIYICSGNRLLYKMLGDFHKYTKFVRKTSYEVDGRSVRSVNEHKNIFYAIQSKNPALAEELSKNHAIKVKENIMRTYEQIDSE